MQDRVKAPAIALIIVGALNALTGLSFILFRPMVREAMRNIMKPDDYADMERRMSAPSPIMTTVQLVVLLAISGFIVFGGMEMMKLRNRPLAITAAILAIIPCCDVCCPIG